MHRIDCPWCGKRDEAEFQYQGDATKVRPKENASEAKFFDYVYLRDNPRAGIPNGGTMSVDAVNG